MCWRRLSTADDVLRFLTDDVPSSCRCPRRGPSSGGAPARAHVTRAKLKPGRKLTVSVDVTGDGIPRLPVAVTWDQTSGMSVLVAPVDPAFPQLPDVYDPVRLSALVAGAGPTTAGSAGPHRHCPSVPPRPAPRGARRERRRDGAAVRQVLPGRHGTSCRGGERDGIGGVGGLGRTCPGRLRGRVRRVAPAGPLVRPRRGGPLRSRSSGPTAHGCRWPTLAGRVLRAVHDVGVPFRTAAERGSPTW
jgi:hypothetical protein